MRLLTARVVPGWRGTGIQRSVEACSLEFRSDERECPLVSSLSSAVRRTARTTTRAAAAPTSSSWICHNVELSSNSTGTSFPVTSSRTCWRRRQLPRNKLAEVSDTPDHLDMSRWSESRQLPRNFLVTSWRLPRNICYGKLRGNWSQWNLSFTALAEWTLTQGVSAWERLWQISVRRRRRKTSNRRRSRIPCVVVEKKYKKSTTF